jgi:hypothetical protein
VVFCNINTGIPTRHFVLALQDNRHSLNFFDPYPPEETQEEVEILETDYFSPNLRISRAWLDGFYDEPYRFGKEINRECLLMWKE